MSIYGSFGFALTALPAMLCVQALAASHPCQIEQTIPIGAESLGSSSVTNQYQGKVQALGGQTVYVQLKNENLIGASFALTIKSGSMELCTYQAFLPGKTTRLYSAALLKEPPIPYEVTVSIGPESKAAVLTFRVYSKIPVTLPGNWKILFAVASTSQPWLTFTSQISQVGAQVSGSLSCPTITGRFWCTLSARHCVGKMRLGWDHKDWEEFDIWLNDDYKGGTGRASSWISPTQTDRYSLTLSRH